MDMGYARKFLSDTHLNTNSPPSTLAAAAAAAAADPPESVTTEETNFVIILAALLCALICVVGLMAVARCAWLRRGFSGGGARPNRTANKGLKKKVLNSLPKYTYTSEIKNVAAASAVVAVAEDCVICLAEYADGDEIRVLPHCGHRFHVQCIDTWLGSHSSCPACRQNLGVTRCRKCGEFPAVGSAVAGGDFVKPSQVTSTGTSTSSTPTFLP